MDPISKAANAIRSCKAVVVATGAGMGVDSGLPDFRGDEGFWNAYPPFKELGLSFIDLANPRWFTQDPEQAWGFYGHRLELYRATKPHDGYRIIRDWAASKPYGCFAFTSNVDGHFQTAGFDPQRVFECHGSFSHFQCSVNCSDETWESDAINVDVEESTMRARQPLPVCKNCEAIARPNILMFGDMGWIGNRTNDQSDRYNHWLSNIPRGEIAVIEIGAGTAIPSVRRNSERLVEQKYATLIRINPREARGPSGTISIKLGGLQALQEINEAL